MSQIYNPVKVATTVNINIGTAFSLGVSKIDNIIVGNGDRVLVKSQSNRVQNGIYALNSSGFLIRASDFAATSSQLGGLIVFVQEGDTFADTGWVLANNGSAIVGTSEIYFETFTVNQKLQGAELPSSIVLRSEKGYPLTNDELDNNFKFLSLSLTQKLNVVDFTPEAITTKINTLSAEEANLDAFALQSLFPSYGTDTNTIAVRDEAGTITATNFFGDLEGNASTATLAARATIANNVDGTVQVFYGGTGASTAAEARTNLEVVGRGGDTMTGKLTIQSGIQQIVNPALNLVPVTSNPQTVVNGDVWTTNTNIVYRLNNLTRTVAPLESPTFTGSVIAPNPEFTSNSGAVATTKFVQDQVTALNTSIDLKSNINAPTFTGDAKAVTTAVTNETTSIATTAYVKNKVTNILGDYYNKTQVDTALTALNTNLSSDIDDVDEKATEALERSGLPVGSVAYFAGNAVPSGWLKCNGAQISTIGYPSLFAAIGYTYGGQGNFFRLPDLRGEFLRGWDDGRGVDANRVFGSSQASQIQQHKHVAPYAETFGGSFGQTNNRGYQGSGRTDSDNLLYHTNDGSDFDGVVNPAGVIGNETRPRNVAMMACIKAFGTIDDTNVIQATAVLNNINNKVDKTGDTMTGFLTLASNPTSALHAATKSYVDNSISTISLTPGPPGDKGDKGDQGNPGLPGTSYTFTYGNTQYVNDWTNIIGSWDNRNSFDVFPPAGKTVNNLVAFIPSIAVLYYQGVVNFDDATRCTWEIIPASTISSGGGFFGGIIGGIANVFNSPGRIRVYVQNTEQRSTPAANWLAIWN
jgi:microcystin-dependent protein